MPRSNRSSHRQPMQHVICLILLAALIAVGLSGCSQWVYRQDIQQGNVLDEEDLNRLQLGMNKRQVQVLLGSPSVQSPFHSDRWDYVNTYASRGEAFITRTLTLVFADGELVSIEGNYLDQDSDIARQLRSLQSADRQLEEAELFDPD